MISLKKYLDTEEAPLEAMCETEGMARRNEEAPDGNVLLPAAMTAYRSALIEMGLCSLDASPTLGPELKQGLCKLEQSLSSGVTNEVVEAARSGAQQQLQSWGRRTAMHQRQQAGEVKEILLVMARTAESVGQRDQRCARQITEVTTRLKSMANLEDLTEIRACIEKSASELKTSIDRMTAEGNAVLDQLRDFHEIEVISLGGRYSHRHNAFYGYMCAQAALSLRANGSDSGPPSTMASPVFGTSRSPLSN